jgi:hypothetical protein
MQVIVIPRIFNESETAGPASSKHCYACSYTGIVWYCGCVDVQKPCMSYRVYHCRSALLTKVRTQVILHTQLHSRVDSRICCKFFWLTSTDALAAVLVSFLDPHRANPGAVRLPSMFHCCEGDLLHESPDVLANRLAAGPVYLTPAGLKSLNKIS